MREGYKNHVSAKKKQLVEEFAKLIQEYPIIGVVNLENLPTQQLNSIRKQLRKNNVIIKMCKRSILKLAIEKAKQSKKNIEELENHLKGMPALLFAKDNPFSLYKLLKKNKSRAPAKAGQIAPIDLVVNAGPTSFAPGPIISELAAIKIKTKVENGKLTIVQDTVVAKKGEVINDKLASMLLRLGIEPMEIGLDLVAVYENGIVFEKSVLDIDEDKFIADLKNCARWAFNLSVEICYPTKENISTLLGKSSRQAKALALESNYICKETITEIITKANNQMLSLKNSLGI